MVLEKTLESPLECKEIQPVSPQGNQLEYSLEGLMLKMKFQYFGLLMRRASSLENTLMLGKIGGKRRRGRQRMRWLDGITDKDATLISNSSPPVWLPEPKGSWEGEKRLRSHSRQITTTPCMSTEETQDVKNRILATDSWNANDGNDFIEPRLLNIPIHKKALNSLP